MHDHGVFRHILDNGDYRKFHIMLDTKAKPRLTLCNRAIRPRHWIPFKTLEDLDRYCQRQRNTWKGKDFCKQCMSQLEKLRNPLDRMAEI